MTVTMTVTWITLTTPTWVAPTWVAPTWVTLWGGAAAALCCLLLMCLRAAVRRRWSGTTHGTARFATRRRDLKGLLYCRKGLLCSRPGARLPPGAVLLGHWESPFARLGCGCSCRVVLDRARALQHGIIVGGSGVGKSYSFFLPNAIAAAAVGPSASLVCADPKSELWRHSARFHARVWRFAPGEPQRSRPFNLIPLCKDARLAELCARAIVESGNTQRTEQVWLDLETAYLAALFSHAATLPGAQATLPAAYRLLTTQTQTSLMKQLACSGSPLAREQAVVLGETTERMRGSIVPALAARLQFLRDPSVQRFLCGTLEPPDFGRLRETPTAVYWCLREQDIVRLRPLTAVFFTLLLEQLVASASAADPQDKRVGIGKAIPVTLLLDEFATVMGSVPQFETTLALARGRGLALWLGVQSLAQLEACYGKAGAQVILTNCATKIALPGLDVDSATYLSRALGETTVLGKSWGWQRPWWGLFASSATATRAEQGRALLTPDEVRRLPEDFVLVLTGNRFPLRLRRLSPDAY